MIKRKRDALSLQAKLAIGIIVINLFLLGITLILHLRTAGFIRSQIYGQMESETLRYQQTIEEDMEQARLLQINFFTDRKLPFVLQNTELVTAYERRDILLSLRDRIDEIVRICRLVEAGEVYLPKSGYKITNAEVSALSPEDDEQLQAYLEKGQNGVFHDEGGYYILQTGEYGFPSAENVNCLFVLRISDRQLKKALSLLEHENGGVFLSGESEAILTEGDHASGSAAHILEICSQKNVMIDKQPQKISVDGDAYIITSVKSSLGNFYQYVKERELMSFVYQSWINMVIFYVLILFLAIGWIKYMNQYVHRPLEELIHAMHRMREGDFSYRIYHDKINEFQYIYQEYNNTAERMGGLVNEVAEQKNLVQQAQMKQLQAQINPHFLYNSFFILSRKIKREDYDGAEQLSAHLGNYFKYVTRDGRDYLELSQELEHVRDYAAIQLMRFSNRLTMEIGDIPGTYQTLQVPRLIMQPLVENAFNHGIRNKESDARIVIRFVETGEEFCILVEDNGDEASDKVIKSLQDTLSLEQPKEVTALLNIHRRLQIYFKQKGGLRISRSELGGICCCIHISRECLKSQNQDVK